MTTTEERGPGQPMDRGQMNKILNEAAIAFSDPLTPWDQGHDARLLSALAWMRNDCPNYYKSSLSPLLIERAGSLAQRAEDAIKLWVSTSRKEVTHSATSEQEDPFVQSWLRILHAFRSAFVACTNSHEEALKTKNEALIAASRASAQSLLSLWERGHGYCPPLTQLIRERQDLILLRSSEEEESRKLYEEFRWHTVRWAIILAKISQSEASDARWSAELAVGQRTCPVHSAGLGPATLAHVYVRYGFTPEIIVDLSLAAYRNYDEDSLH